MKNDSAQKMKAPQSPAPRRDQQVVASAMDGSPKPTKRKASPDTKAPRKRTKYSDTESQNKKEEDLRVKVLKRKGFEVSQEDLESASTSTDTDSSSNVAFNDVSKKGRKRKFNADGEGPSKKKRTLTKPESTEDLSALFQTKYKQGEKLGAGGCGSVFAGFRKADNVPVAIKHIPKDNVVCKHTDQSGNQVSIEVAVMKKLASGTPGSVGTSASVSLLDWYDLDEELILVLERPVPSKDLLNYTRDKGGALQEEEAKTILTQLVDAAKELEDKMIFHRDIKVENILIESGSNVPGVRLIDFGLSCFVKEGSFFRIFYGTSAHVPPEWYERCTYKAGPTTVWQLGVVLYDCLHKRAAFETNRFLGKRLRISKRLSEDCQDFLRTCLTKAPEERPTLEELKLHPWLR
nr:serine/threonine-protein kinase pim-1-like [Labrus bergylta]